MHQLTVLVLLLSHQTLGKIYELNETEYRKMPALYKLDDYQSCMLEPGSTFCVVDADLFAEDKNDLMMMIQGYTEVSSKHYNYTQIHRGICVTDTCKDFIGQRNIEREEDLNTVLEGCVNNSLWNDYKIQAKLAKVRYCKKESEPTILDTSDFIFGGVIFVLIVLNTLGSFYDICKRDSAKGNPYLLAFSVRRNWRKLVAPSGEGPDPRLARLKGFNGLRTMTIICVLFSHTTFIMSYTFIENPLYVEKSYDDISKQILFNGSLVVHTFFVMSGFLLAYNFELLAEKHRVGWMELPKGMLLRWIRLTPTYALVLGLIATLMRHMGSGPLWDGVVTVESDACRQYWWAHLLYINNYIRKDVQCLPQTWYLAADTQLFAVGLVVCIIARTARARKIVFGVLTLLSFLIPALHTYFQDLDAVVIQSPETVRSIYENNDTFRNVYIPGHTNLSTYTMGIAGGMLVYHWQTLGTNMDKFKNYRWLMWASFPTGVLVILSGAVFYNNGERPALALRVLYGALYKPVFQFLVVFIMSSVIFKSETGVLVILSGAVFYNNGERPALALRVLYGALYKPVFQFLVVFIMSSVIFKSESLYRGVLEWRGFTWGGRVSYGVFLLHSLFQRGLIGPQVTPVHLSDFFVMMVLCATIFLSFTLAAIMWMLVEAPVKELIKTAMTPKPRIDDTKM